MMFVPAFPPSVAGAPVWYSVLQGMGLLLVCQPGWTRR